MRGEIRTVPCISRNAPPTQFTPKSPKLCIVHGVKRDMCGTYRSIEENGGLYGVANISANVAAISTYSAGALVALHLYAAGWDNWYHASLV